MAWCLSCATSYKSEHEAADPMLWLFYRRQYSVLVYPAKCAVVDAEMNHRLTITRDGNEISLHEQQRQRIRKIHVH